MYWYRIADNFPTRLTHSRITVNGQKPRLPPAPTPVCSWSANPHNRFITLKYFRTFKTGATTKARCSLSHNPRLSVKQHAALFTSKLKGLNPFVVIFATANRGLCVFRWWAAYLIHVANIFHTQTFSRTEPFALPPVWRHHHNFPTLLARLRLLHIFHNGIIPHYADAGTMGHAWNSGQGQPVVDAPKPPGALL